MQIARRAAAIIQSSLILVLLSAFSESVAVAISPDHPVTAGAEPTCAHCYSTFNDDRWRGEWGLQCYDYESPTCRGCPESNQDCAGGGFATDYDLCNNPCNDAILEVAKRLDAAVLRDDPNAVRSLLDQHATSVSYNSERNAIDRGLPPPNHRQFAGR